MSAPCPHDKPPPRAESRGTAKLTGLLTDDASALEECLLAFHRAAPPMVLSVRDLALVIGRSQDATLKAVKAGQYGPWRWQGRRVMLLRETMLAHLEQAALDNVERMAAGDAAKRKRRSARDSHLRKFGPPTGKTGGA